MAKMATWAGFKFVVSAKLIRGFENLTVRHSCETEENTSNNEGYLTRKAAKPTEVTLTVKLNALTGCDVEAEYNAFAAAAMNGTTDYLYVSGHKLVSGKMMLTDARTTEIVLSPSRQWISAKVELSFKQATRSDGGTGGGGGGSGKASVKKAKATTSNPASRYIASFQKVAGTSTAGTARTTSVFLTNPTAKTKTALSTAVNKAQNKVDKMMKTAKTTTAAKKTTTTKTISSLKTKYTTKQK
jgi:hypothetical protein